MKQKQTPQLLPTIGATRRDFIRLSGGLFIGSMFASLLRGADFPSGHSKMILLEAEQFDDLGGWDVDQQSMEQMGSAYLLAHGLGVPVKDAVTMVKVSSPGLYRVWVRTRDWVAPWRAPGAPGKFQLLIDGKALGQTFGTEGEKWHWQDGGVIELGSEAKVALHDLTGFEGRCDAVLFCKDANYQPPNELAALTSFRRALLGLSDEPEDGGEYDLVVVGGGIAGSCAALSAARNGLKVALVQDRPVLGGNGSSEVRVWPEGHTNQQPYPHVGDIVRELLPEDHRTGSRNAKEATLYADARKMDLVHAEPRINLLTDERAYGVETEGKSIRAILIQHTHTGRRLRLKGRFFADCTGDATVGFLAGADYEMTREQHQGMSNLWNVMDASDPKQVLNCECKDKTSLGIACEAGNVPQPFPRCPWAIDLSDKPFPGRSTIMRKAGDKNPNDKLGAWFWESGFDEDPIADIERIRDQNLRAMYGAWDALKNVDHLYPNHRLGWAAFIAGKRESRRLLGDVILDAKDFLSARVWPDPAFPCTWAIDLHLPNPGFQKGLEGEEFISMATVGNKECRYKGPYWAPYRCLYSRNITNLFMAGRDISVTHEGLGPVRVMRTCGMMGEIVGKAASICIKQQTEPRGVYEKHLPLLQQLMTDPVSARQQTRNSV